MIDPKTLTDEELEREVKAHKTVAEVLAEEDIERRLLNEEQSRRMKINK